MKRKVTTGMMLMAILAGIIAAVPGCSHQDNSAAVQGMKVTPASTPKIPDDVRQAFYKKKKQADGG